MLQLLYAELYPISKKDIGYGETLMGQLNKAN